MVELKTCRNRIVVILEKNKITDSEDVLRIQYFLHTLRVFETEVLARLKDWDQLLQIVTVRIVLHYSLRYSLLIHVIARM